MSRVSSAVIAGIGGGGTDEEYDDHFTLTLTLE